MRGEGNSIAGTPMVGWGRESEKEVGVHELTQNSGKSYKESLFILVHLQILCFNVAYCFHLEMYMAGAGEDTTISCT